jgi:hypothetical protein
VHKGCVNNWKIIVNKIIRAGFCVGWVSALDNHGRRVWIINAHGDGQRFIMRADEILTAFVELQRAVHPFAVSLML